MANTEKEWTHFEHNLYQWDTFKSWNYHTIQLVEYADNKKQKKVLKANLVAEVKKDHYPASVQKLIIDYIKNHL